MFRKRVSRSLAAGVLGLAFAAGAHAAGPLTLEVYNPGDKAIFPVSSEIVAGKTEAVLIDMGCNCAQGYLYAPAMPVDEFIEWWKGSPAAAG